MKREYQGNAALPCAQKTSDLERRDLFGEIARKEFISFVSRADYPCVGAKAALNAASFDVRAYKDFGSVESSRELAADLAEFRESDLFRENEYASFIAVFQRPGILNELAFERLLWRQLGELHRIDAEKFHWDPHVKSDPADPEFSFSFGGQAFYVIGLHPESSRLARRFRWPALVFNAHEQFERLRAEGKWRQIQKTIRSRDLNLQGSINPMLSDFGERSEARQYSGRAVEDDWRPDFSPPPPARCPFHH